MKSLSLRSHDISTQVSELHDDLDHSRVEALGFEDIKHTIDKMAAGPG